MSEKILKFNSEIKFTNEILNENFHKARLTVMHSGLNLNNSFISEEVMKSKANTIKNTPLLAHVLKDDEGKSTGEFGGHDISYEEVGKDEKKQLKVTYLEQPIGVIPESADIKFELIDNKLYLTCDAYIWKTYSNDAYDILLDKGIESVSCEITCYDVKQNDDENKSVEILDFEFLGVTVIGVAPGMEGANINMNFSNKDYLKKVKELNELLKTNFNAKEDENVSKNAEQSFSLSIDDLYNSIWLEIKEIITTKTDPYWGDTYSTIQYSVSTIIPDDKIVVLYDWVDGKHYGIEYKVDGDYVKLDFDTKKEYISEWREKTSNDNNIEFENKNESLKEYVSEKFNEKEKEISELKEKLDFAEKEISELKEFKNETEQKEKEIELNNSINEVLEKFSLDESEILELKSKVLSGEMDIETFTLHLKAIQYDKNEMIKQNFSQEDMKNNKKIPIEDIKFEEKNSKAKQFENLKDKYLS